MEKMCPQDICFAPHNVFTVVFYVLFLFLSKKKMKTKKKLKNFHFKMVCEIEVLCWVEL